jgi:hypothetical protein
LCKAVQRQHYHKKEGVDAIMTRAAACVMSVFFAVCAGASFSHAQGRIDPALPPRPLIPSRTAFIFTGVNTVKNPDAVVPPLTVSQKFWTFRRRTFDFGLPAEALMFATISQYSGYGPRYGSGPVAFSKRFASYSGSIASSNFFAGALLPAVFHQDPRYFRKDRGSASSRLLYAVRAAVVTHSDSGDLAFNVSGVLGFGMSAALSNAWYPQSSLSFGHTMQRFGIKVALGAAYNVLREFGGHYNGSSPR